MQQLVKDALSGSIFSRIRGVGNTERNVTREQVSNDILDKELVYWAYDWVITMEIYKFGENFFSISCAKSEINFLLDLVANLICRPKESTAINQYGTVSDYVVESALKERPFGVGERIIKYGARGATACWQASLTDHDVGIAHDVEVTSLYIRGRVHSSFKSKEYVAEIWLREDKLASVRCICVSGNIACHHTFVLLMQTEICARLPVGLLTASLNDAYAEFYGTQSIIDSVWNNIAVLTMHDFGSLNENELKNKYKPGTEKRKMSKKRTKSGS